MKHLLQLFLLAFIYPNLSSASNSALNIQSQSLEKDTSRILKDTSTYRLKYSTADLFNQAKSKYVNQLLTDTLSSVHIINDSLFFVSANGIKRSFRSDSANSESEDQKHFNYAGHYKSINSILIEASYYEWGEYILVNKKTGRLDSLNALPHFSPKNKYMATCYVNGEGGMFINVCIYKTHGNSAPLRIINLLPETWMPFEAYWLNEKELIMQATGTEENPASFYLELTIK